MDATPHNPGLDRSEGVVFDHGRLGQLSYHVRWAAALAAAGHAEEGAPHAIMASAILDTLGGEALRAASSAFDLPEATVDASSAAAAEHRRAAVQLGMQLVSHFTADGRHDLADLYMEATRSISAGE